MEKIEIHSYKVNKSYDAVPRVAPCCGPWPPAWLAALNPPPDAPQQVNLAALRLRGWRFPNGVVVCRGCCRKPTDAVSVLLTDGDDGPEWVEEPAVAPCSATVSPKAALIPEHSSNDPQWL